MQERSPGGGFALFRQLLPSPQRLIPYQRPRGEERELISLTFLQTLFWLQAAGLFGLWAQDGQGTLCGRGFQALGPSGLETAHPPAGG